eukprot:5176469-Pyramimonas_sp.AAC.1
MFEVLSWGAGCSPASDAPPDLHEELLHGGAAPWSNVAQLLLSSGAPGVTLGVTLGVTSGP